jgi:hypothetical protein
MGVESYVLSDHAKQRMAERNISEAWVSRTLANPAKIEPDPINPRCCNAYAVIPECRNLVLKVVYDSIQDPIVVVTVYFDRKMKGKL